MTNDALEFIPGTTNIILVAPHGFSGDDDNTGFLVREMTKKLNCYAVINEVYRRPDVEFDEQTDVVKKVVNCNDTESIKAAGLTAEWLDKIDGYKNDIVAKNDVNGIGAKCTIFFIHGAKDEHIKDVNGQADLLLGTGGAKEDSGKKPRPTAIDRAVQDFIEILQKESSITAVEAKASKIRSGDIENRYAGHDQFNLNQCFVARPNGILDPAVQSFQLEIKMTGFRDKDSLGKTASRLATAICKLTGVVPVIEAELVEEQALLPTAENNPDEILVEAVYTKLKDIFVKHYHNALSEAGKHIIDVFFEGSIELARKKKPVKELSYTQLIMRLEESNEASPRKSWFFNAVNLVIQEHDFASVQALGQLNTTHKLLLLSVRDPALKIKLAEQAVENNYTSRELAGRIKQAKEVRTPTLLSALAKPEFLFFGDGQQLYTPKNLSQLNPKKVTILKSKIIDQERKSKETFEEHHRYLEQYQLLRESIDSAQNTESSKADSKKVFGTQEWASKNVNISTGCSNNCKYCYARHDAIVRFNRVQKGEWEHMIIRSHDVFKRHPKYDGMVMFPSSHDIVPENLCAATITLENLLKVGNQVLIVSKPRKECIETLCKYFRNYKKQILFRFTIGAMDDEVLNFWEPGASKYAERKECLQLAFDSKFRTSVSAEPMLDSANIDGLVEDLLPLVTDALWIGKFNNTKRVIENDEETLNRLKKIEAGQTDKIIKAIYARHKDPKIKWKESIKKVVGIKIPTVAGLDE